jgi:Fe-S-cluster containining protein
LRDDEINSISDSLGLSREKFIDKYLIQSAEGYEIKSPCCFLNENGACAIQWCKPAECMDFPHTDKPDRLFGLLGVLSFAEVCPIVFEMLERLKAIYNFRTGR